MNIEVIINYSIGIVSLILAVVFYVKSIKKKEPTYTIKSVNVISEYASKYENLVVSYKNEVVENFTVSKILFYNRGRETITKEDIGTIFPIRISSETCDILDASVLQVNKTSNNLKINLDRGKAHVYIDFDYMDKNQGAVIQVVHAGLSSDNLVLDGDIKGVQKLSRLPPNSLLTDVKLTSSQIRLRWIEVFLSLIFWLGIDYWNSLFHSISLFAQLFVFVFVSLGALSTIILAVLIFDAIEKLLFPRKLIPVGLEKFKD